MKQIITLLFVMLSSLLQAQQIEHFNNLMPEMYNFKIYAPEGYNPETSRDIPLVLFLHGRSMSIGLNGTPYGPIESILNGHMIQENQPALILEPNAKSNEGWSSEKLHKVYEFVKSHYAFDHERFYVIGMSMGGWGTLNYVSTYPDEVAACIAIGGGCDVKRPCGLNRVPSWIIHAADDQTTSVKNSDRVVDAMQMCGNTSLLKYSRLSNGGHNLTRFFSYLNLYEWLYRHRISERRFDTDIDFVQQPKTKLDENKYLQNAYIPENVLHFIMQFEPIQKKEYEKNIIITEKRLKEIRLRSPRPSNQITE